MPTIPRIARGVEIGTGPHITINYAGGSPAAENVSLASGTWYLLRDNSSNDLLKRLDDALTSASNITSATVSISDSQLVTISVSTSASTVDTIDFTTTQLYPQDFGFALDTSTTSITFSTNSATATYRPPISWSPSTQDFDDVITRRDKAVSLTADDGSGVDDFYSGHKISSHDIPEVYAALTRNSTTTSDHAGNVSGLATGDTNATLETFLVGLSTRLGGAREHLYLTPDIDTPTTNRRIKIGDARLLSGVEGWIVETNRSPLFYDMRFELIEVD